MDSSSQVRNSASDALVRDFISGSGCPLVVNRIDLTLLLKNTRNMIIISRSTAAAVLVLTESFHYRSPQFWRIVCFRERYDLSSSDSSCQWNRQASVVQKQPMLISRCRSRRSIQPLESLATSMDCAALSVTPWWQQLHTVVDCTHVLVLIGWRCAVTRESYTVKKRFRKGFVKGFIQGVYFHSKSKVI